MGGVPPLGYDVRDRRLVVNRAEAATVKHIYQRYLELGSVRLLRGDLERRKIISKLRLSKNGVRSGGRQFSRGALYELLSNPIYLGEIRHRKERHPGQHQPIVSRELWEKVQRRLCDQAATHRKRPTKTPPSPLAGKLFDEHGEPLYVQGAVKGVRHYRYYVSRGNGPSRAAPDAAGVPGAKDHRSDRRRPAARRPQYSSDDPKNRTAPALERATASSGTPIDLRS